MTAIARILVSVFGRRAAPERSQVDPTIESAVRESRKKTDRTHQLLSELRSRTELSRLARARALYEERLHGTRGH